MDHLAIRAGAIAANSEYDYRGAGTYSTESSWGPVFGIYADLVPFGVDFLRIETGGLYSRRQYEEQVVYVAGSGSPLARSWTRTVDYLSLPILLKLTAPRRLPPYITMGPSFEVKLSSTGGYIAGPLDEFKLAGVFGLGVDYTR